MVRFVSIAFVAAACTPASSEAPGPSQGPEHVSKAPIQASKEAESVPSEQPPPAVDPPARAYPKVYCGFADDHTGKWVVRVDPGEAKDVRRAERLADRYPNADGAAGRLSRTNVPEQWREIRDVTLVSPDGVFHESVTKVGIRAAPSGGAFYFILGAKTYQPGWTHGIAIDGHVEPGGLAWKPIPGPKSLSPEDWKDLEGPLEEFAAKKRPRSRPPSLRHKGVRKIEADFGGGLQAVVLVNTKTWGLIGTINDAGALLSVPLLTVDAPKPPVEGLIEYAEFEPLALVDLDRDGHDELVVSEEWSEGSCTWIVRYDPAKGLVADRLCGDAA